MVDIELLSPFEGLGYHGCSISRVQVPAARRVGTGRGEERESVPSSKELDEYDIRAKVCGVDIHTPELVGILEGNRWDFELILLVV